MGGGPIELAAAVLELIRHLSKPFRAPDNEAAVEAAINDCATEFPEIEVRFGLKSWERELGRSRILQDFVKGKRGLGSSEAIDSFIAAGFFAGPEEDTRRVAGDVLNAFSRHLLFRLSEKGLAYAVARGASELETIKQVLETRLPDYELRIAAEHVEQSPTPQSKLLHHRVTLARDLLKEGHPKSSRQQLLEIRDALRSQPSSQELRFRIAMNLGACSLELGELDRAETEFNRALDAIPEEPKALANLSLVASVKGRSGEAVALAERAYAASPRDVHSSAALIQALARAGDFARIENLVASEESLAADPRAAFALGHAYFEQGDYERAVASFEVAVSADEGDGPAHLWCATAIFRRVQVEVLGDPPLPNRIRPAQREMLERAEALLSRAVEIFSSHDNPERRYAALTNRAGVRSFLGRLEDALTDCDHALSLAPPRDETLANKGRLLLRLSRPDEAIETFNRIADPEEQKAIAPLLAHAYLGAKKPSRAAALLERYRNANGTSDHDIRLAEQLMHAYTAAGEQEKAEAVVAELQAALPSHPGVAVVIAQRRRAEGRLEDAINLLKEADSKAAGPGSDWIGLQLAELYQLAGQDSVAADLYARLVDESSEVEAKAKYVVSLFNAGRYVEALEHARKYRGGGRALPVISEIESLVLERTGDLASASQLLMQLGEEDPLSAKQLVKLGSLNLRMGDKERAAEVTQRISFDSIKNDVELLLESASLRMNLDLGGELQLLYQARRIGFGRPDVHMGYLHCFLQLPSGDPRVSTPEAIGVETAVSIRQGEKERTYLIIEDPSNLRENELNPSDPLASRLLGKRAGDKVRLGEGGLEEIECEILRVETKFAWAAKETLDEFPVRFPGNLDIQRVSAPEGDISRLLAAVESRHGALTAALEEYRRAVLPLGLLQRKVGLGFFRTWAMLVNDPSQVLLVATGLKEDFDREKAILSSAKELALDASGLFTVKFLGLEEALLSRFTLSTNQSLTDSLMSARAYEESFREPYEVVGKEGETYVRREVPGEAAQRAISFLTEALALVREKTASVPVQSALDAATKRDELLKRALGEGTFSAVALARERSVPLFADDLGLRRLAESEFGVQSVSIQSLLFALRESGALRPIEYHVAIGKLFGAGYRYIVIESETILEALRQDHMEITPAVTSLCWVLEGPDTTLDSSVDVATGVLRGVALESLTDRQRDLILDLILRNFLAGRLEEVAIPRLIVALQQRLRLLPVHLARFLDGIRLWTGRSGRD